MSWPQYRLGENPEIGTIVMIVAMGHLSTDDKFDPIGGGMYAEIVDGGAISSDMNRSAFGGALRVLTLPRSATEHHKYPEWSWGEPFPYNMRGDGGTNGMRFEVVPEEIRDAVLAFYVLHDTTDGKPIVVDDGFLC